MKKIIVIVGLLLGNVVFGQRSLTSSEAKDLEITTGFRNGDEILEFTLEDGNIVKKGSEFIIGTPLNPTTFTYTRIYVGYYNLFSEILSPSITLNSSFKGTKVVVETLKVNRQKLKRKSELMILAYVYDPAMSSLLGEKRRTIVDLELALSTGEVVNPNQKMTREQAIVKLKESKDLLDLGLLTQEEYDKIKAELTPIIMKTK
jgi:hypothetical protein